MLVYPEIDPIALTVGPVQVHWYGIMYLLGFGIGWGFLLRRRGALGLTPEGVGDLVFAAIIGVIAGGRLGYVLFYQPGYYLQRPLEIAAVWDGGMSFHGGLIGLLLAGIWFARWRELRVLDLADQVIQIAPVGLGLGRIGNFINGELWGRPADPELPWAMVFPHVDSIPRHPSQLYEALLEGLVLFLLVWFGSKRLGRRGQPFGLFLVGYGVIRFGVEYFRAPDPQLGLLVAGLSMGQLLSLPLIGVGLWLLLRGSGQARQAEQPSGSPLKGP